MTARRLSVPMITVSVSPCIGDCCVGAVKRSYHEMRVSGATDAHARTAALTVFRWHHPEIARAQAENFLTALLAPSRSQLNS